ncbi:hypothetical protein KBB27_01350 [Patescibacteria group bacterium]|nr:hypothetical protein [Patescibacteria group bacterium]
MGINPYELLAGLAPNDYDTAQGIEAILETHGLVGLWAIAEARKKAARSSKNGRCANNFIVLGCVDLSRTGGHSGFEDGKGHPINFMKVFPGFPSVTTDPEEMWHHLNASNASNASQRRAWWRSSGCIEILGDVRCGHCGEPWTLDTMFDYVYRSKYEAVSLSGCAGMTIPRGMEKLTEETGHRYMLDLGYNYPLVNREPDLSVHEQCLGEHTISKDDAARVRVIVYEHFACAKKRIAERTEATFRAWFEAAEVDIAMTTWECIPNRVAKDPLADPWFRVQTPVGPITIGSPQRDFIYGGRDPQDDSVRIDWSETGHDLRGFFGDSLDTRRGFIEASYSETVIQNLHVLMFAIRRRLLAKKS